MGTIFAGGNSFPQKNLARLTRITPTRPEGPTYPTAVNRLIRRDQFSDRLNLADHSDRRQTIKYGRPSVQNLALLTAGTYIPDQPYRHYFTVIATLAAQSHPARRAVSYFAKLIHTFNIKIPFQRVINRS